MLEESVVEKGWRRGLERSVGEECCGVVLEKSVCRREVLEQSFGEECWTRVLQRSVVELFWRRGLQGSVGEDCCRYVKESSAGEAFCSGSALEERC